MEKLSTLVIQKALDAFFFGLDTVDHVRRRIDRILGRPESEPFEVIWPEEPEQTSAKGNGASASAEPVAAEPEPEPVAKTKPAATKPEPRAIPRSSADDDKLAARPKVPIEIEDLAERIRNGTATPVALDPEDELKGKRMIARLVYVLGAAEAADLGALTSTEIAHVLTAGREIVTFGTNISRAIRQGTKGLVEARAGLGKEPNRYALTDEGREAYAVKYARTA